jgi:hypothetical protein
MYARRRGWPGFVANQMLWSLAAVANHTLPDPTMVAMDTALLDLHIDTRLPAIPYASQANGFFQGARRAVIRKSAQTEKRNRGDE